MFLIRLGLLPVLLCVSAETEAGADDLKFHISAVIGILEDLESHLSETSNCTRADLFWELSCPEHEFCQHFHGPVTSGLSGLPAQSEKQRTFLKHLVNHTVDDSLVEHGVLLTPDGTTVSLSPVLAGIAAGLRRRHEAALLATPLLSGHSNRTKADPLLASLARNLGMAFLLFRTKQSHLALGPNGCWDSISAPQTFTLMGSPSHLPDAFINGAMDGLILSTYLTESTDPPSKISTLLSDYYGGEGLQGDSQRRSNFRRKNFADLVNEDTLREQVESSLHQLWRVNETGSLFEDIGSQELTSLANQAVDDFMALYVVCPAIIPRCMWRARPYRGTPVQLKLPVGFVYIHHTFSPGRPCLTFPVCAANMRSMQRFHQDDRGWDDIGYSFVVGGDGYLYQGRGWHWVGAHTRGFNSKGYGIGYIGDYMKALPDNFTLELVRDNFMQCAVRGSRLQHDYTIHGHRQMVPTLCPGDRLFKEIETWKGFKKRCLTEQGVHRCI
ncbi:N-acetylmuramoyl-L-alanine amidase [Tiliqua scincoides]|uniref:N-acetylmuramoyl-L-alanine amidase n=1 Tax=Tiliqua scincoides TaxID=71010 RepID=UPI003463660A